MKLAILLVALCLINKTSAQTSSLGDSIDLKIAKLLATKFNEAFQMGSINNIGGLYTRESIVNFWEQNKNQDTLFDGAEKIMEFYEQLKHLQYKVEKTAISSEIVLHENSKPQFNELEVQGDFTIVESSGTRNGQYYAIVKSADDPHILYEEIILPF